MFSSRNRIGGWRLMLGRLVYIRRPLAVGGRGKKGGGRALADLRTITVNEVNGAKN